MTIITAADPITAHDWKPSYTTQPAWLIDAREIMNACWRAQAEASPDERERALEAAVAAQEWYQDLYNLWMAGCEPTIVTSEIIEFSF